MTETYSNDTSIHSFTNLKDDKVSKIIANISSVDPIKFITIDDIMPLEGDLTSLYL